MLNSLVNIVLYIPRTIYGHFRTFKKLKKENTELEIKVQNRELLLKRIDYECKYYMRTNQALAYEGFRKIKELAQTFGNDTSSK